MSPAKVTLSQKERELVTNGDWILTKNAVIVKVGELFGNVSDAYNRALAEHPLVNVSGPGFLSPKISKGENYRGLPWVMLDHPRNFTGTDHFAVRSFFWWGMYCSITLQLSGSFAEKFGASIEKYFSAGDMAGWYTNASGNAWEHHFETDNYVPLGTDAITFRGKPLIKLARRKGLEEWDELPEFFDSNFRKMLAMLSQ